MKLITVSRQSGSLGTDAARAAADKLGCTFLDRESLEQELARRGLPESSLERYDERRPAFWEIFSADRNRYLHFLRSVVYESARRGKAVVLGRGGQALLGGLAGALHVRLIAPLPLRIARLQEAYRCDRQKAEQMLRHTDRDRAGFHRFFFNIDWEEPSLYDLVINTGRMAVEGVVELIAAAVREVSKRAEPGQTERQLEDLCLKQEIETRILYTERLPVKFLETEVRDGVVTLTGTVSTQAAVSRCAEVAAEVPGVKEVVNQLYFSVELYGYMPPG